MLDEKKLRAAGLPADIVNLMIAAISSATDAEKRLKALAREIKSPDILAVVEKAMNDASSAALGASTALGVANHANDKADIADDKAVSAEAKASAAQQVQARRDSGKWQLIDYLAIFLSSAEYDAVLAGDIANQNEIANTMAVRSMHDDFMTWYSAGNYRTAELVYPAVTLAINDELFSEPAAQMLWDMTGSSNGQNRCVMHFDGTIFVLKNWTGRAAVRTSGYYAAHGITYPVPRVVFRWMQGAGIAICPKITGSVCIRGQSSIPNDPVGVYMHSVSKPCLTAFSVNTLYNTNFMIEECVNGDFDSVDCFWGGYQPTEFGGGNGHIPSNVRFSNVGGVITATIDGEPADVFESYHEGKYFGLAGSSLFMDGVRAVHWSTIASVDSPSQITMATAPAANVSEACASFEAMRVSTFGTTWSMSASIGNTLVGRSVTLLGARVAGSQAGMGTLNTIVISHSEDTIEVAHAPAVDVTDALLIFSPLMWIDSFPETGSPGRTDNVGLSNLRLESTAGHVNSCVPLVLGNASTMRFDNAKLHGSAVTHNNFGGTACTAVLGYINGLNFDGALSQATRSPRYGAVIGVGGTMVGDLRGKHTVYPENNRSALVYLDPILPPESSNVALYWGMISTSTRFPLAQQTALRLGPNGRSEMVMSFGSERRSYQSGSYLFPTGLGLVTARSYGGDGVAIGQSDGIVGQLMPVGFGGNTGNIVPVLPPSNNLNLAINRHGRVRTNPDTLHAPASGAWLVDLIFSGGADQTVQIAYSRGSLPRIARRRVTSDGLTATPWAPIYAGASGTTAQRPSDPLPWEQYGDVTLGRMIVWTGTAWTDFTGNVV